MQYVGVASGQKEVMLLGGNLPYTLSQHLKPENDVDDEENELETDTNEKRVDDN
jgi:hypothetical protein